MTPESLVARAMLPLLKRKELDSKNFSNDEIILGNFKGNDSLPLANRGNAFVSLRGGFGNTFKNRIIFGYSRQLPRRSFRCQLFPFWK